MRACHGSGAFSIGVSGRLIARFEASHVPVVRRHVRSKRRPRATRLAGGRRGGRGRADFLHGRVGGGVISAVPKPGTQRGSPTA
jgi:hypothetical protein